VEYRKRRGDRYWSDEEHTRFIEAVKLYGKNWGEIATYISTRSRQSIYSHA
jgi:MYB-related transcription factor LHY